MKEDEHNFIKKPEYPGGKTAMKLFINNNLHYPLDAIAAHIEGIVSIAYEVSDEGIVVSSKIIKSLYPSCDEEALRIVNMFQYGKVHNRGLRLKANYKINIIFSINKSKQSIMETAQVQYDIKPSDLKPNSEKNNSITYSYSINLSE